jgi:hypothetical protein
LGTAVDLPRLCSQGLSFFVQLPHRHSAPPRDATFAAGRKSVRPLAMMDCFDLTVRLRRQTHDSMDLQEQKRR